RWQECARGNHCARDSNCHDVSICLGQNLRTRNDVLAPTVVIEPRRNTQKCRVCHRESSAASTGGVGGEDGQDGEDAYLQEDVGARPTVAAGVELAAKRNARPSDPRKREDDRELEEPTRGNLLLEALSRLRDNDHVDEVIEALERANTTVRARFAMRARWSP